MNPVHGQRDCRVRFDWGVSGARAIAAGADLTVVVDVLSFTTTVSVAADAGIEVFPSRWRDESAATLAAEVGASLAVQRSEADAGAISLSPGTIRLSQGSSGWCCHHPTGRRCRRR